MALTSVHAREPPVFALSDHIRVWSFHKGFAHLSPDLAVHPDE